MLREVAGDIRESGERHGEGRTLRNLGKAYRGLGQVEETIGYYEKSLAIFQKASTGTARAGRLRTWATPTGSWGGSRRPSATTRSRWRYTGERRAARRGHDAEQPRQRLLDLQQLDQATAYCGMRLRPCVMPVTTRKLRAEHLAVNARPGGAAGGER